MMPDPNELRQALEAARTEQQDAHQNMLSARELVGKLQRERELLLRSFDPNDEGAAARLAALEKQISGAQASVEQTTTAYQGAVKATGGLFSQFEPFTDPREMIGNFDASLPILLMPLRIETRFKTVSVPGAPEMQQLWVRVYPDDCSVDTFEPVLSESEMAASQSFWRAVWAAAGDSGMERGAWAGLTSGFGAGRAAYVAAQYRPENSDEIPVRADASDIFLIVSSEETLSNADKMAMRSYWIAVWQAGDDVDAVDDANNALVTAVGAERAAEIMERLVPFNLDAQPIPPHTREDTVVDVGFIDFPPPATVDTKLNAWTQAPRVVTMPDRLVLIAYTGTTVAIEQIGGPIPSPLIVGPDPSLPEDEQLRFENGELVVPDDIQWMFDFERAVSVGMAFKVDLTPTQAARGFDQLYVLGVRLSANKSRGKEMVETLFEHHHYSRKGMSLLPQGTPTNNTDDEASGHTSVEDSELDL